MRFPEPFVLIVDDDADIRDALTDVLTDHGYRTDEASNGRQALDKLRAGARPSLILLDLMMPVMDGLTFRQEQLDDPELAQIPALMISASQSRSIDAQALELVAVLAKPIDLDRLLALVSLYTAKESRSLATK